MNTALQNFIQRHALENIIHAQALQNALDEEREMIIKCYQGGADDTVRSFVDDNIPNGESFYKKTFY